MYKAKMNCLFIVAFILFFSCQSRPPRKRLEEGVSKVDALVVVHPTYNFDQDSEAKTAISFVAEEFLRQKKPIYTLVESPEDLESDNYQKYFPLINKTTIVFSKNGENAIRLEGKRFVLVGGYIKACLRTALIYLSRNYLKNRGQVIEFFLPLPAIYGKGLKVDLDDWKGINLHHWLPPKTSLTVLNSGKVLLKLNEGSEHAIIIHFRGRSESPFVRLSPPKG